ncbi:hypothetical protein MTO96_001447 [Rhipicephalus appendiculatus]
MRVPCSSPPAVTHGARELLCGGEALARAAVHAPFFPARVTGPALARACCFFRACVSAQRQSRHAMAVAAP